MYTKGLKSYLLSLKNAELYERKGMLNGMFRMAESERDGVSHRGGRSMATNRNQNKQTPAKKLII